MNDCVILVIFMLMILYLKSSQRNCDFLLRKMITWGYKRKSPTESSSLNMLVCWWQNSWLNMQDKKFCSRVFILWSTKIWSNWCCEIENNAISNALDVSILKTDAKFYSRGKMRYEISPDNLQKNIFIQNNKDVNVLYYNF